MKSERSINHLPEDLVVEILCRVPTSSLARLRSISKGWNALVKEGRFAKKHSAPSPSLVLLLTYFRVYSLSVDLREIQGNVVPPAKVTGQFSLKDPLYNSFKEVDISHVYHCDCEGLLLCTTKDKRLFVWNPCSGETRWIQPRDYYKESDVYAIGYDNKSSCCKILRMDRLPVGTKFQAECEVYDFSSNAWRVVGVTTDWYISQDHSWNRKRRGTSGKGNTYWLAISQDGQCIVLLSFDFSTERFQTLSLHLKYWRLCLSVTREDQLCMLVTRANETEKSVYMATRNESTGALSWTKFLTLLRPDGLRCLHSGMSFLVDQENKVVLSLKKRFQFSSNIIIHIVGEDTNIKVDLHGANTTHTSPAPLLLSYAPSFVQIQQDTSSSLER